MENKTIFSDVKIDTVKLKKVFMNKNILFIIGILGIALIFLSDLSFMKNNKNSSEDITNQESISTNEYITGLENKLSEIIKNIDGAGNVKVMVTLESSEKSVYAVAEKTDLDINQNVEQQSSEKTSYQSDIIIVENENGNKTALKETTLQPQVKGVAVVCSGGDKPSVQNEIMQMVSTVLGVSSNRVCVTKMTILESDNE